MDSVDVMWDCLANSVEHNSR